MTYDEQTELIKAAVDLHFSKARFRIDVSTKGLKKLRQWLADNNITDYQIIELFSYMTFDNHKDAVMFRLTHDNELLENKNEY